MFELFVQCILLKKKPIAPLFEFFLIVLYPHNLDLDTISMVQIANVKGKGERNDI